MYLPKIFENADHKAAFDLLNQYSFATLITHTEEGLLANHLPLVVSESDGAIKLAGHMARPNPQWRHFSSCGSVLAIFQGPHSYISPSWYVDSLNVPTWNYAVVHVYGKATSIEDRKPLKNILAAMTDKYESAQPQPWRLELPEDFMADLMNGIVGFEIVVERIESKFKLSQNRSAEDRNGVLQALSQKQDDMSRAILALMNSKASRSGRGAQ